MRSFFWTGVLCVFVNIPFGSLPRSKGDPFFVRENHGDGRQLRKLVVGYPIGQGISLWHRILEWGRRAAPPWAWEAYVGAITCEAVC